MSKRRFRKAVIILVGAIVALTLTTAHADATHQPRATNVRVVTYAGFGVTVHRASHQLSRLHRTSADFRDAVTKALNALWRETGSKPKCATAPLVVVKRWRSDGWARIEDIGNFQPCPSGGHWEIWQARHGTYTAVLAGQEEPTCRALRRHDVPRGIWAKCFNAQGTLVRYTGP